MDWMYLVYFSLGMLLFFGAKLCPCGEWNEGYTSRDQTKVLTGIMALGVVLHHMAQKTCASWIGVQRLHGLDVFVDPGFLFVAVFFFCSGLGLYRSVHSKPDYLKGFLRRRVLRIAVAFYLSEFIYTAARLLMGEKMDPVRLLWYLSGLHMANTYSWYVIAILFFYLAFWAAFRFCRKEGTAIFWVFAFTLAYTVLGTLVDHQSDWWMRGEWWYNSVILFPLGLLFGRFEKQVTRFFRRGYLGWLALSLTAFILLYRLSGFAVARWGYYGEGTEMKVLHRLLSTGSQWLACAAFVALWFLLMMKVRLGNRALAWLGAMSLEIYLVHGLFVELFGYSFLNAAASLVRIRNVPLYVLAVLGCSVPAAMAFHILWRKVSDRISGIPGRAGEPLAAPEDSGAVPEKIRRLQKKYQAEESSAKVMKIVRFGLFPLLFALLAAFIFISFGKTSMRSVSGVRITPPQEYSRTFSDSRYEIWEYTGEGKKPGRLILDTEIRGSYAQKFIRAEEVLADCSWLQDAEIYTNPQGIRMARGISLDESGIPERRYYVETDDAMFLLCMSEDSRYYDPADCEETMKQTADSIRRR